MTRGLVLCAARLAGVLAEWSCSFAEPTVSPISVRVMTPVLQRLALVIRNRPKRLNMEYTLQIRPLSEVGASVEDKLVRSSIQGMRFSPILHSIQF